MTVKRNGLGRNLSALLGQSSNALLAEKPAATPSRLMLGIDCLQPGKYQPRGEIDDNSLQELAESIKKQGILQPLIVRELSDGNYEIIAGERRWRASHLAGLTEVPVNLKQVDDETAMAIALIENLQREDLNAMDQARAMYRLASEFSLTHQQIAELLAKSRTAVSNFLRLLSLSEPVKKMLEHGDIDMGHARALLVLDEAQQVQATQIIIAKNLSVRETEKLVERIKSGSAGDAAPKPRLLNNNHEEQLSQLATKLRSKIKLKTDPSGKGSLIINYSSEANLKRILEQLL